MVRKATIEMKPVKVGTQLSFLCRLCHQPIIIENGFRLIGRWTLHEACYPIAIERLAKLAEIVFLPALEFEGWLEKNE